MDSFILWKCDDRQVHNPASEAGSLVQIQPPQPNFFCGRCVSGVFCVSNAHLLQMNGHATISFVINDPE